MLVIPMCLSKTYTYIIRNTKNYQSFRALRDPKRLQASFLDLLLGGPDDDSRESKHVALE